MHVHKSVAEKAAKMRYTGHELNLIDFEEGFKMLGIDFYDVTHMLDIKDVFSLFDTDGNNTVSIQELLGFDLTSFDGKDQIENDWANYINGVHSSQLQLTRNPKWIESRVKHKTPADQYAEFARRMKATDKIIETNRNNVVQQAAWRDFFSRSHKSNREKHLTGMFLSSNSFDHVIPHRAHIFFNF